MPSGWTGGPFSLWKTCVADRAPLCVVIADLTVVQLAENDMLVDEYDQYPNEKTTDVVVSSPGSDEPTPPSAADRTFLFNSPSPSV